MAKRMTHASLFSGIGGAEVAAAMLGWTNLFHCEINPFGRAVLEYHYPNAVSYEDITKTDFTEWRGHVDVLTGGFPCQPFSYAGKRGGAKDDRYLWPAMLRAIKECRPTWVIGENVSGITTMVEQSEIVEVGNQASLFGEADALHTYEKRERYTIERICSDLERIGYTVQPVLIPACAVGAPHRRDRVFILGHTKDSVCVGLQRENAERGHAEIEGDTRATSTDGKVKQVHTTNSADARTESVRRERKDAVYRFGLAPNADSAGRKKRLSPRQQAHSSKNQARLDDRVKRYDSYGSVTHATSEQCTGFGNEQSELSAAGQAQFGRNGCKEFGLGSRWERFPTISAIHRGNDGLPFNVDGLSLPWVKWRPSNAKQPNATFNKWRTESLKAYGNAIVPQVMYEIFRAIEIIENK